MIRAALVARSQLGMFRPVAIVRDCTKWHCKVQAMVPSHTCYKPFGTSGGDKPKNTPPGYTTTEVKGFSESVSSEIKTISPNVLGSDRSLGKDQEGTTTKGFASTDVEAPKVFGTVVTGAGKIDGSEPLEDTTLRSKSESRASGSGPSEDDGKSDAQKKASAAKDAAAKQLSEIVANLPSKQQTEKYFFRVVAFIYDLTYLTGTWLLHFFEQNVIRNQTVQHYWKRFHEKMEQAKKD
ncbi:uncharacterized protein [Drosophila bipectinata]|uniref:uncharacterized protein n=1 Tax=Drosophila bipectinata TaxID=42026 RepID=UPI001C890171|nr:uncharacterized protein LOC108124252 [Drosophila bipectinata]